MMSIQKTLLAFLCVCVAAAAGRTTRSPFHQKSSLTSGTPRIPVADGLLHVYALPVGQGDSTVIQCPNGDLTIVDLGTSDNATSGYWNDVDLTNFFQGQFNRIRSVVLSHNHYDHYQFIPKVLDPATADLSGLDGIFISCSFDDMVVSMKDWIGLLDNGLLKLRPFNGGLPCGPNGVACEPFDVCRDDVDVRAVVLAVNSGQQCTSGNKNTDSIVFKLIYNGVSVLFNGDFEDFTTSWTENGPIKALVDFYTTELKVTAYQQSHHGASSLANKPIIRDAVAPKAVFTSGNSWYSYGHPRCAVSDAFIQTVQSLCKPEVTDTLSAFYCGEHPISNLPVGDSVQRVFTCGLSSTEQRTETTNDYAIYSTVPDSETINVVEFLTDGTRWGFINNLMPRGAVSAAADPAADAALKEHHYECGGF